MMEPTFSVGDVVFANHVIVDQKYGTPRIRAVHGNLGIVRRCTNSNDYEVAFFNADGETVYVKAEEINPYQGHVERR